MTAHGGPNIVEDGLVLYLDAANVDSYASGSTTWKDLSGNGNNGTLINGPTFDSGSLGSIAFDGVDNYIEVPNSTSLTLSQDQPNTFEYIIYNQDIEELYNGGILSKRNFFNQYAHLSISQRLNIYQELTGTTVTYPVTNFFTNNQDKWMYVAVTYDGSIIRAYRNGFLYGQSSSGKTFNANANTLYIGCNNASNYFFLGKISLFKMYNRALSAEEVLQNYNATKSRYI